MIPMTTLESISLAMSGYTVQILYYGFTVLVVLYGVYVFQIYPSFSVKVTF